MSATYIINCLFHLAVVLVLPIWIIGIINRVKSLWAGRRGPRLNQVGFDLFRLLKKKPVYSTATSWVFPLATEVVLATTLTASLFSPIIPGFSPLSFEGDFVLFAYLLGLGKIFTMLGALDTASPFEGMGASREATYSALAEPVLFLGLGTMVWASGATSFDLLVIPHGPPGLDIALRLSLAASFFMVLLIESSRVPADDPTTHLELTMVHEVMILDHSGPELAIVQYASAIKMTIMAGIIACILNPFSTLDGGFYFVLAPLASLVIMLLVAVAVGLVESLTARLRFRTMPFFTLAAFVLVLLSVIVVSADRDLFK